jgi:hypothetical protein
MTCQSPPLAQHPAARSGGRKHLSRIIAQTISPFADLSIDPTGWRNVFEVQTSDEIRYPVLV